MTDSTRVVASCFVSAIEPRMVVKIRFRDGSSVVVAVDANGTNLDPNSIGDANGNIIPFSMDDLNGRSWSYGGGGGEDPHYHMAIGRFSWLGVPIQNGASRWACVCSGMAATAAHFEGELGSNPEF